MLGKGGRLCSQARQGEIRCPLIIRPTSEDVVTGHLAQTLRVLPAMWWLPDLLNVSLGATRFRRQHFRNLKIEPWQNRPCFPSDLLPWSEGSTQVDLTVTWENPPTTVLIEAKYLADLSESVSGDDGRSGFPSDQLIRNIRVGLLETGYYDRGKNLFSLPARELIVLVFSPRKHHPLVRRYRDPNALRKAIPHGEKIKRLPRSPFVGEFSFRDVISLLREQSRWFNRAEKTVANDLAEFLEFKLQNQFKSPNPISSARATSNIRDLIPTPSV
jgi:hypothetical protein